MDRASDSGSEGRGFKSLHARRPFISVNFAGVFDRAIERKILAFLLILSNIFLMETSSVMSQSRTLSRTFSFYTNYI